MGVATGIQLHNVVKIVGVSDDLEAVELQKSGMSIAMGNASAAVQKAATYVTTSCDDEGFANAMEKIVLRES